MERNYLRTKLEQLAVIEDINKKQIKELNDIISDLYHTNGDKYIDIDNLNIYCLFHSYLNKHFITQDNITKACILSNGLILYGINDVYNFCEIYGTENQISVLKAIIEDINVKTVK